MNYCKMYFFTHIIVTFTCFCLGSLDLRVLVNNVGKGKITH